LGKDRKVGIIPNEKKKKKAAEECAEDKPAVQEDFCSQPALERASGEPWMTE
jgi:hypothetical protein